MKKYESIDPGKPIWQDIHYTISERREKPAHDFHSQAPMTQIN